MIQHVACIMDGNRRWAKKNGVSLKEGVLKGLAQIDIVVDFCVEHKIPYLSLYAFSIENLKRTRFERACVFNVIIEHGIEYAQHMAKKGIKVNIVGDRLLFPQNVCTVCDQIESITKNGSKLCLQLLFCYGGRQEIVSAVQKYASALQDGKIKPAMLTEDSFKQYLWLGAIPDPDLIIRTGFANRLSNFMMYQAAYSELYFPSCLWPDISVGHLQEVVENFNSTKRNFGA